MVDLKTIARKLRSRSGARRNALTEILTAERVDTYVLKYVVPPYRDLMLHPARAPAAYAEQHKTRVTSNLEAELRLCALPDAFPARKKGG